MVHDISYLVSFHLDQKRAAQKDYRRFILVSQRIWNGYLTLWAMMIVNMKMMTLRRMILSKPFQIGLNKKYFVVQIIKKILSIYSYSFE